MGASAYDDIKEQAGKVEAEKVPAAPAVAPTTEPAAVPAEAPKEEK